MNFNDLQLFINENCLNVRKLKTQLTDKNFDELMKKFTYEEVISQLMSMENYKPLSSKYTSVYLTLLKWFQLDEKKGFRSSKTESVEKVKAMDAPELLKNKFLKEHPVGSRFEHKGKMFLVEDETFLRSLSEDGVILINQFIKVI